MNAPLKFGYVNVHEAKTNFSRLLERARAGEEIVIAKAGKPWARLGPIPPEDMQTLPPRQPGRLQGLLGDIPDSVWFDPFYTDDELDAFEGKGSGPE